MLSGRRSPRVATPSWARSSSSTYAGTRARPRTPIMSSPGPLTKKPGRPSSPRMTEIFPPT